MKKALPFLISLVLIFIFCGCSVIDAQNKTDDSTPIVIEVADSTSAILSTTTKEPMFSPTPTSTPNEQKVQLEVAPEIEGLTKVIRDLRVVYTYDEGNPYKGESGEYAGVYKGNVTVAGEEVGGVCMEAKVCEKLLEDALAQIPDGEPKVKVIAPLDVTSFDGDVKVETVTYNNFGWYAFLFDGQLPFVDTYQYGGLFVIEADFGGPITLETNSGGLVNVSMCTYYDNGTYPSDELETFQRGAGRITYSLSEGSVDYNSTFTSIFGSKFFDLKSFLVVGIYDVVGNSSTQGVMPPNTLLRIDNGPVVFIKGSQLMRASPDPNSRVLLDPPT